MRKDEQQRVFEGWLRDHQMDDRLGVGTRGWQRGLVRRLRLERRRALESMRAVLDEDRGSLTKGIRRDT